MAGAQGHLLSPKFEGMARWSELAPCHQTCMYHHVHPLQSDNDQACRLMMPLISGSKSLTQLLDNIKRPELGQMAFAAKLGDGFLLRATQPLNDLRPIGCL